MQPFQIGFFHRVIYISLIYSTYLLGIMYYAAFSDWLLSPSNIHFFNLFNIFISYVDFYVPDTEIQGRVN